MLFDSLFKYLNSYFTNLLLFALITNVISSCVKPAWVDNSASRAFDATIFNPTSSIDSQSWQGFQIINETTQKYNQYVTDCYTNTQVCIPDAWRKYTCGETGFSDSLTLHASSIQEYYEMVKVTVSSKHCSLFGLFCSSSSKINSEAIQAIFENNQVLGVAMSMNQMYMINTSHTPGDLVIYERALDDYKRYMNGNPFSKSGIIKFIEDYGTNYITNAILGSRLLIFYVCHQSIVEMYGWNMIEEQASASLWNWMKVHGVVAGNDKEVAEWFTSTCQIETLSEGMGDDGAIPGASGVLSMTTEPITNLFPSTMTASVDSMINAYYTQQASDVLQNQINTFNEKSSEHICSMASPNIFANVSRNSPLPSPPEYVKYATLNVSCATNDLIEATKTCSNDDIYNPSSGYDCCFSFNKVTNINDFIESVNKFSSDFYDMKPKESAEWNYCSSEYDIYDSQCSNLEWFVEQVTPSYIWLNEYSTPSGFGCISVNQFTSFETSTKHGWVSNAYSKFGVPMYIIKQLLSIYG